MALMYKFCLALAVLAAACTADSVVPVNTQYEAAHNYVTVLLQQGKDTNACAQLAKTLENEVSDDVDTLNKLMAQMSDGSECVDLGQDAVTAAQGKKDGAIKAEQDAEQACEDAKHAPMTFEKPLDTLTEGECGTFLNDAAYLSAKEAKDTVCTAVFTARAATEAAHEALKEAQEAATRARHVCQCKAKTAMDKAFKEAQQGDADRAANWAKAHHMACVLEGTPPSQCQVPDVPAVSKVDMHGDVANAICFGYIGETVQESGRSCPTNCPRSAVTLKGRIQCIDFGTDRVVHNQKCDDVDSKKPDADIKHCAGVNWGQGNCFLSNPQGDCYDVFGGCIEERREGWQSEERRECFSTGQLRCKSGYISGNTKYLGCYRGGNNCHVNRI